MTATADSKVPSFAVRAFDDRRRLTIRMKPSFYASGRSGKGDRAFFAARELTFRPRGDEGMVDITRHERSVNDESG